VNHPVVAAAKKAGDENELGVTLPVVPTQFPAEPNSVPVESGKSRFHWASYALNDAGNEVEEIDYMSNFYKRFNKVNTPHLYIILFISHSDLGFKSSTSICKQMNLYCMNPDLNVR